MARTKNQIAILTINKARSTAKDSWGATESFNLDPFFIYTKEKILFH